MAELVISAAKGSKKAMTALYEANKREVYALCIHLLSDTAKAADITAKTFNASWDQLIVKDIKTDKGFGRFVKCEAAKRAADEIFKSKIKNFRIARVNAEAETAIEAEEFSGDVTEGVSAVTAALLDADIYNRFVFLLKAAGGLSFIHIGQVIAQRETVARYYYQNAVLELENKLPVSTAALRSLYSQYAALISVPQSVDVACKSAIKSRARFELPSKRALTAIVTVVVVLAMSVGAFFILLDNFNDAKDDSSNGSYTQTTSGDKSGNESAVKDYDGYVPPAIDLEKTYYAKINIKDHGTVTVKLAPEEAPMTVANFVNLANNGFYDGLTFHRIIEGFMMQGGDPKGNGTGGSDNNIFGEFESNGFVNNLKHEIGVISMARSGNPNSASSQFFIVQGSASHLDGDYAAFGKVTEGMEIVNKICTEAEPTDGNGTIPAAAQPIIESVKIVTE